MVEQFAVNELVVGSSPTSGAIEKHPAMRRVLFNCWWRREAKDRRFGGRGAQETDKLAWLISEHRREVALATARPPEPVIIYRRESVCFCL